MKSRKRSTAKFISFVILLILSLIWITPLIWAIGTSFKDFSDIISNSESLIPSWGHWTIGRYIDIFSGSEYPVGYWLMNSLISAMATMFFTVIVVALAAYAFVFIKWKGRDVLFTFILITLMIPNVAGIIPSYTMIVSFGWERTLVALIVPSLANATLLFIVRQFFLSIPHELIESAKVDGANSFKTFIHVVLPLGKSPLILTALFSFMWNWNDLLWPQIVMLGESDMKKWTLPAGLILMNNALDLDYGIIMCAAIVSSIPVLVIYMFLQNKIIEGVSRTGLK